MQSSRQPLLLEIPEQPLAERPEAPPGPLKLRRVDRQQSTLTRVHVDDLIGPDHKARAIRELTGQLNLSGFQEGLKTREGQAGREAWDPRLLVRVWVYSYSEGINSARKIEREMEWEPGLQWLTGLEGVNHHTLSDFRVQHGAGAGGGGSEPEAEAGAGGGWRVHEPGDDCGARGGESGFDWVAAGCAGADGGGDEGGRDRVIVGVSDVQRDGVEAAVSEQCAGR